MSSYAIFHRGAHVRGGGGGGGGGECYFSQKEVNYGVYYTAVNDYEIPV